MSLPLDVIIVERLGSLKMLSIKDFKLNELYKKCGFKKPEDFKKQTEWTVKFEGKKYLISVFAQIRKINMIFRHRLTIHYFTDHVQ